MSYKLIETCGTWLYDWLRSNDVYTPRRLGAVGRHPPARRVAFNLIKDTPMTIKKRDAMLKMLGPDKPKTFNEELCELINRHSMENGSNTPDYILANYLEMCLTAFGVAQRERDSFYGYDEDEDQEAYLTVTAKGLAEAGGDTGTEEGKGPAD